MTLISFIVFRDSLWLENPFNGLVDEIWEGGRVLTQEWCYLDLVWMVHTFFEPNYLLCGLKPFIFDFLMLGIKLSFITIKTLSVYLSLLYIDLFHLYLFYLKLNYF